MNDNRIRKKIQRGSLFALAFVIAVSGAAGGALVAWCLHGRALAKTELLRTQKETSRLKLVSATAEESQQAVDSLRSAIMETERDIPAEVEFESFYETFSNHATAHGVILHHMEPGQIREEGLYRSLPIAVSAEARFSDLYSFLLDWGTTERITTLDHVTIQSGALDRCEVELTMRLYCRKP